MAQEFDNPLSKVDDTSFVEDDWNVVFAKCSSLASKWQELSTHLGLQLSTIDRIKSDSSGNCVGCLSEALKEWIKMNYNTEKFGKPSWKTLLNAIAEIDMLLFNTLAAEHQASTQVHQTTERSDARNAFKSPIGMLLSAAAKGKGDHGMGMRRGVIGASAMDELSRASLRGDLKKVKELIELNKLDPLQKEGMLGANDVHLAALFGQLHVLRYFIEERECSPASQDNEALTPLHYASCGKHLDIIHYLVAEQKMDPLCCADSGLTPLHLAAEAGDINVIRYLVDELRKFLPLKDIVTSRGINGQAPIHHAAFSGHLEIVKFFVDELNCDPNIALPVEYQGRTTGLGGRITLHHAAQGGHLHIIKYLVEQCNCNPSHLDSGGVTPLHLAALWGQIEVVQYLTLERYCNPLCTNKNNDTPLHVAAYCGHLQLVRFFTDVLHCPPDVRGQLNMTPLKQARNEGHRHVVQYLESIHPRFK